MRLLRLGHHIVLNGIQTFRKVINWIGYVSISFIILVTFTNVIGRYLLKKPLIGEIDMVELGMAIFGGVAMFLAAIERHHVKVDVLVVHFPKHSRVVMDRVVSFLGFITWSFLAYRSYLDGLDKVKNNSSTATLLIPQGPFEIVLSILIFIFGLTLFIQVFSPEGSEVKQEGEPPL
jgi:TRAP-type C4-dicarboxylate transport system permease small subunit